MIDVTKLRNTMRYIAAASSIVVAMGAGSAFASVDVEGTNDTTGFDSTNTNTWTVDSDVDVVVTNDGTVTNDVTVDVEAGDNTFDENTTLGDIETGDVDIEGDFENEVNAEDVDIDLADRGDVSGDFTNDTTGAESDNSNALVVDQDATAVVTNDATMDNTFDLGLSTGGNDVTENTTVGDVSTGDIDVEIDVENVANSSSMDMSDLMDAGDVDFDATNDTTGAESANTNTVVVDNDTTVTLTNTATIDNTLTVDASTGDNTIDSNTTVGDFTGGDINIRFNTTNTAN